MMNTIANTPAYAGSGWDSGIVGVLRRGWTIYSEWRTRRKAVAQLRALSDHALKDMGLSRADINLAVKGIDVRHRPLDFAVRP